MTQAVLVAHSYLTSAVELILFSIVGFFKSLGKAIIVSRQAEANQKIVPYLRCEYPGWSDAEILAKLNREILREFEK
jgi:hypothetical protein